MENYGYQKLKQLAETIKKDRLTSLLNFDGPVNRLKGLTETFDRIITAHKDVQTSVAISLR